MGDKILDSSVEMWDMKNLQIRRIWAANTAKAMANTLTAITEGATYGLTFVFVALHGYSVGSHIRIKEGETTNYDGQYVVKEVVDTSNVEVNGLAYGADETGLTAVIQPAVAPGLPFRILNTRFHASGTCATENFTITLDSGFDSKIDVVLFSQPMASVLNIDLDWSNKLKFFTADDAVVYGFANGNGINWGLEVIYQFLG